ncbi:hypothetical protein HanRHA438_Chr12g0567821 [Helianthus annuus]|nr:hypothetical protein HanIR_Chr12g0600601 [Helianthus annuus]KAJ0867843.1 hypothetical protein HanRHA438_Chr12g0567821 [Helianthus annuus]
MCTVEIKSRFSTNDLNGSRKSINTHPHFLPKAHLNLILALQVEVYASYLRVNRIKSLRGPFVSILSFFSFVFIVKVKLRLTFCFDQFMVNAKFI